MGVGGDDDGDGDDDDDDDDDVGDVVGVDDDVEKKQK